LDLGVESKEKSETMLSDRKIGFDSPAVLKADP